MGMFVVVPTYILKEIRTRIAAFVEGHPTIVGHEAELESHMIEYLDVHGRIPTLSIKEDDTSA